MTPNPKVTEELVSAARGLVALILGDRKAPQYFDFSLRGLCGSFIAILALVGVETALPMLFGATGPGFSVFRTVMMAVVLFGFSIGAAAIVLRQLKRLEALVPYVTVANWANFWLGISTSVLALVGFPVEMVLIAGLLVGLTLQINTARLIVTLSPLQIGIFLIAQLICVSIGLILVGVVFPLSPAELAALEAASIPPA